MYVGPWQEYRAMARARHAEALYATRGPAAQVADDLERLRRALELVSGELPADKAAKVREALSAVAEPAGPPPLPGLSWSPRAAARRPAPVVRPVKPPQYVLTSLRLDDVRGGAATFPSRWRHLRFPRRRIARGSDRREGASTHPRRHTVSPTSRTRSRRRSPRGAARRRGRSRPGARGPRPRPSTERAEATTGAAILERGITTARPPESRAPQATRERRRGGRRSRPRSPARAGENSSRGNGGGRRRRGRRPGRDRRTIAAKPHICCKPSALGHGGILIAPRVHGTRGRPGPDASSRRGRPPRSDRSG